MGRFSCKIMGRPTPQVTWLKGDVPLQASAHLHISEKNGMQVLEIHDVSQEDVGMYTCLAVNGSGKASMSSELSIQGLDHVNRPLVRNTKAPEADSKKDVTNGLVKRPTQGDPDIMAPSQNCPSTQKSVSAVWTPNSPAHSPKDCKLESFGDSPAKASCTPILQKTSSTITLQSTKVQPKPNAVVSGVPTLSRGETERTSAFPPAPISIRQSGLRSQEVGSKTVTRMIPLESQRESTAPKFESKPQSQQISEDEAVEFRCKVSGIPKPQVAWFLEGVPVRSQQGSIEVSEDTGFHCLRLQKAREKDSGQYSCTASNTRGQVSCGWTLLVKRQPIQYARSTCKAGMAELHVQDALPEDEGTYSCLAQSPCGQVSCSARVIVHEKKSKDKREPFSPATPSKSTAAPRFLQGLTDLRVMDGSQVTMTVQVSGNPTPEVIWLHNGKEIQESEDFHFETKGTKHSLCIQEVFPEDTGTYTCEAWNSVGEARSQAVLMVQEPQDGTQPWFISKPRSVTASLGQSVLISCAIAGDPFPTVHWLRNGKALSRDTSHFEVLQNEDVFTLVVKDVQPWHAGQYEILLRNQVGECSCQVSLMLPNGPARALPW